MIVIRRKCPPNVAIPRNALQLCAFNIYWRNPKFDRRSCPDDCHLYPDHRRIDIMPSIFHKFETKDVSHSYNLLAVDIKTLKKALTEDGIKMSPDDRLFYCRDDGNDEIPIESDSDLYDALIYAKNLMPDKSVKIIIEGDFVSTKNGLVNMKILTQSNEPATNNNNDLKCHSENCTVPRDFFKDEKSVEWFQTYLENYKKEIIADVMKTIKNNSN